MFYDTHCSGSSDRQFSIVITVVIIIIIIIIIIIMTQNCPFCTTLSLVTTVHYLAKNVLIITKVPQLTVHDRNTIYIEILQFSDIFWAGI